MSNANNFDIFAPHATVRTSRKCMIAFGPARTPESEEGGCGLLSPSIWSPQYLVTLVVCLYLCCIVFGAAPRVFDHPLVRWQNLSSQSSFSFSCSTYLAHQPHCLGSSRRHPDHPFSSPSPNLTSWWKQNHVQGSLLLLLLTKSFLWLSSHPNFDLHSIVQNWWLQSVLGRKKQFVAQFKSIGARILCRAGGQ